MKDKHKESKNMHKTSKNSSRIPCDACDHISPSAVDHKKHADESHKKKEDYLQQHEKGVLKMPGTAPKVTTEMNSEKLICDFCDYGSSSARNYMSIYKPIPVKGNSNVIFAPENTPTLKTSKLI